jgi:uncharacterized protein (TIGR02246 family)
MDSSNTHVSAGSPTDEDAIRAIHRQLIDAWNEGNGEAFAASFTDEADFIVFEGTHLKGRREIAAFAQRIFDTVVKSSRLEGEVKYVRFLSPELAAMHSVVRTILPGQTVSSPSRDSIELYVVTKGEGGWRTQEILNARKLTMECQFFLDDFASLSDDAQRQVTDLVASLERPARLQ